MAGMTLNAMNSTFSSKEAYQRSPQKFSRGIIMARGKSHSALRLLLISVSFSDNVSVERISITRGR